MLIFRSVINDDSGDSHWYDDYSLDTLYTVLFDGSQIANVQDIRPYSSLCSRKDQASSDNEQEILFS